MDFVAMGVGFAVGGIVVFIIASFLNKAKSVPRSEFDESNSKLNEANTTLRIAQDRERALIEAKDLLIGEKNSLAGELRLIRDSNAALSLENGLMQNRLATQKLEIEGIQQKFALEFENLANKILETKSEKFTETNRDNISKILQPLSEEIASFKKKVEDTYNKESQERFSLGEKVKELIEQTDKVSSEANNLATALKGSGKRQGDWGEVILERILEISGLERGREYKIQDSIKNDDGETLRPDVLIFLPDHRNLIIDSKVTLVAYDRYCSAESDEDCAVQLAEHIRSINNHIDQLQAKKYDEIDTSLDFVLMFIPIEPAYMLAVQKDTSLWERAYKSRIILISPTNIIAVIKLVSDLWKREMQSKHAQEIAKQGAALYDKFALFLETLDDVGNHIRKTQMAYDKASNQLKLGKGNLVSRAERLKNLGLATRKSLPASMANFEDTFVEDDPDIEALLLTEDLNSINKI